jgi:hypothetical protein
MTYVNLTGKFIGECLTGFGIHWPISIINSGNSDVSYSFKIENDADQLFSISDTSLIINNGDSAVVNVLYKPEEVASAIDNTCDFLIYSESVEDGTPDPSGVITVEITGSRIINNTGGHVRNLVALKNYDITNWINYDFIWSPPTGTGNLKNYFFTGYQLDISKNNIFTNIVFSTGFNIAENTDKNPRFGKYYGYNADEKIIKNISSKDFTSIDLDQDYYARLYTYSVGNSGINIFASGIDTLNDQLSNEVVNGFSGAAATRPNLRFYKKMLDVIVTQGNYVNYNLYQKILDSNAGSSDLSFYSGINIYLSAGSVFSSSDENNYALDFKNGIFQNFTGDPSNGTNINIYIPERVSIIGNHGKGGDLANIIINTEKRANLKPIFDASVYSDSNGMSDSKKGGNSLNLNNKISIRNETVVRTDINYNIFIQESSQITAGGGGNKAGVGMLGGGNAYIGVGSDGIERNIVYPIRGSNNNQNTFFSVRSAQRTTLEDVVKLYSPNPQYGEDAVDNIIKYTVKTNSFTVNSDIVVYDSGLPVQENIFTIPDLQTKFIKINNNAASSCGYLVNKYLNSSLKVNFYNDAVVGDYIFRCNNSDLSNTNPKWIGKNSQSTTIVSLTGDGTYIADFEGLGYKAMSLPNTKYLQGSFSSSVNCVDFDLFIVGCFKGASYAEQIFKMLNWYSSSDKVSNKNVLLRPFLNTAYKAFSKENNVFSFFFSLLYDGVISNKDKNTFYQATNDPALISSYSQISKQLNGSGNYYPFILNIQRSNNIYAIFVNGERYCIYGLPDKLKYINDLNNTTLELKNDGGTLDTYFFDIIFYNRTLYNNERLQMYNSLNKQYLKLFAGETGSSLLVDSQIQLPNIFNLAGKINTQT